MCKFESLQKDESGAEQADSLQASWPRSFSSYSVFYCCSWVWCRCWCIHKFPRRPL